MVKPTTCADARRQQHTRNRSIKYRMITQRTKQTANGIEQHIFSKRASTARAWLGKQILPPMYNSKICGTHDRSTNKKIRAATITLVNAKAISALVTNRTTHQIFIDLLAADSSYKKQHSRPPSDTRHTVHGCVCRAQTRMISLRRPCT